MNLIIDIGNTSTKVGIFKNGTVFKLFLFDTLEKKHLIDILFKFPKINKSIISSVIDIDKNLSAFLNQNLKLHIELNHKTRCPLRIKYHNKSTLGNDRIAGVTGANTIFPHNNVMVIDAGTAITYDIVTDKNIFIGGNISPGLHMRFRALHEFTDKLPLAVKNETTAFTGTDTKSALVAGVQNGIIYEIDGYINDFRKHFNSDKIILTGGDGFFFETKLKNSIFAEPNLVLIGLNQILEYNAQ